MKKNFSTNGAIDAHQNTVNAENAVHISVLKEEILNALSIKPQGYYLDGTLGLAGHSKALLEKAGADIHLLGLDRDTDAIMRATKNLEEYKNSVHIEHLCYADFDLALEKLKWKKLDGVLLDLGVSSLQLDVAERGFSFYADAPLDMRMDNKGDDDSAEEFVNKADYETLKQTIKEYGEDPQAGRIARCIVEARTKKSIKTTKDLEDIVFHAYPAKWRNNARNHPATRTFQAIRMKVNKELQQLEIFLEKLLPYLNTGARIAIISFHSLEDRIVKHVFKTWATDCLCSKKLPVCVCKHKAEVKLITKKPIMASDAEKALNPRASSAKLRIAEYIL